MAVSDSHDSPHPTRDWVPSPILQKVGDLVRLDYAAAEASNAFSAIGIDVILLKGPSFAAWLYPDPRDRLYGDVDLLAPSTADCARVLGSLGYEMGAPHPLGIHTTWTNSDHGSTIELHTALLGIRARATDVWRVLSRHTEPFQIAGKTVSIFDEPARALHAALHAASDGASSSAAEDLRRSCSVGDEVWLHAFQIATELDAVDAFSAGLWLLPEGRAIAERVSVPRNRSVTIELRSIGASNAAQTIARFQEAQGSRARLEIIRSLARGHSQPPPAGGPREGRSGLRLVGLIGEVMRAAPVWWRVRHQIRARQG